MEAAWVDHLNLRIPEEDVEPFADFYRDLGFDLEHYEAYRDGEQGFFFVRLGEQSVFHVSPRPEPAPAAGGGFGHVCLFVDEPRSAVRERVEAAGGEVVTEATRLGATGEHPSIYVEDPVGYTVEFKSHEE